MSFTTDLQFFKERALGEQKRVRDSVTLKLMGAVVRDTPVDKGRARGGWLSNVGSPDHESEGEIRPMGAVVEECRQALVPAKPHDTIFLTNNVPYIKFLEQGKSRQAPAGMMRKNVTRFQRLIDQEAKRRMR